MASGVCSDIRTRTRRPVSVLSGVCSDIRTRTQLRFAWRIATELCSQVLLFRPCPNVRTGTVRQVLLFRPCPNVRTGTVRAPMSEQAPCGHRGQVSVLTFGHELSRGLLGGLLRSCALRCCCSDRVRMSEQAPCECQNRHRAGGTVRAECQNRHRARVRMSEQAPCEGTVRGQAPCEGTVRGAPCEAPCDVHATDGFGVRQRTVISAGWGGRSRYYWILVEQIAPAVAVG